MQQDEWADEADAVRLAEALLRIAPSVRPSDDPAWSRPVPVRLIDCVLSLNRNYDRFVVPRLDEFMRAHPEVQETGHLAALMAVYPSATSFVMAELRYNHADRARILGQVVGFACGLVEGVAPSNQRAALETWAAEARPGDYRALDIKGFKLAGFQYLRMLFGARTTKPDKHIIAFVSEELGRDVSSLQALVLLETAAERAQLSIRDVDTSIWEGRARKPRPCAARDKRPRS